MQTDLPHRGLRLTLGGCEAPSRGEGRALPGGAGLTEEWYKILANWAQEKPEISNGWFFGSRAKDQSLPFSDLDIAVSLKTNDHSVWILNRQQWCREICELLSFELCVDLQVAEIDDDIVYPAVQDHGIQFFSAEESP